VRGTERGGDPAATLAGRAGWGLALGAATVCLARPGDALAQEAPGTVLGEAKVAWSSGSFGGALANGDTFGAAVAPLGDLDGDGVPDVAIGVPGDDTGGTDRGGLWILLLNADGSVRAETKVDSTTPALAGGLANGSRFGSSAALVGDLDRDGRPELAVGAERAPGGGSQRGAVWILSLENDGSVASAIEIAHGRAGFAGPTHDSDRFGRSVAGIGDLDWDGTPDLLVGADWDDDGGPNRGAAWILFLAQDGSVSSASKISSTAGGFAGSLEHDDNFGAGVARIGDLDGDGLPELAVSAEQDDEGASGAGAVWILFPNGDGTIRTQARIGASSGLDLGAFDRFGRGLAGVGDVDGDGVPDLAAGAVGDDDGVLNAGAVHLLFLDAAGGLAGQQKISMTSAGFSGAIARNDRFGQALAILGDVDGDGKLDLAVGADGDDEGGTDRGATWILFLETALQPSGMTVRNGLGINPVLLSASEAPRVGRTWTATVDAGKRRAGTVIHFGYLEPSEGHVLGSGELLVDRRSQRVFHLAKRHRGGLVELHHRVPDDPALAGLTFFSQALLLGGGRARLTNALDGAIAP